MRWVQRQFELRPRGRGFHLITTEVTDALPEIAALQAGLLHLFIRHTSASLTLNENTDPTVRTDMEQWLRGAVVDGEPYFEHTLEGADDMPAHVKASLFGSAVSIPITAGRLALGTWQGIYLGEHRVRGGRRRLVATIMGDGD